MKVNCIICNTEIYRQPSRVAKSITNEFYCSKECSKIAITKRLVKWHQKGIERSEEVKNKITNSKKNNQEYCIYCQNSFDKSSFKSYHGENCKHKTFDLMLINLNDFPDYKEFIHTIKVNFVRYHLAKNDNKIQVAKNLNIDRGVFYTLASSKKSIDLDTITIKKEDLKNYDAKVIIAKNQNFLKEIRIKKAREEYIKLTEEELYSSMLPQYLYYMNIKESEYDKSDLIRLPLLIQHYKDIDAEDKVEDLEEILEIIKNKL